MTCLTMSGHIFVMPMNLSVTLLHPLGHNDKSDVKHDFFTHLTLGTGISITDGSVSVA